MASSCECDETGAAISNPSRFRIGTLEIQSQSRSKRAIYLLCVEIFAHVQLGLVNKPASDSLLRCLACLEFVAKLMMITLTSSQFLVPPSHEANYLLPLYSIRAHIEDRQMRSNETGTVDKHPALIQLHQSFRSVHARHSVKH
jgi:hypothetical protein